MAEVTLHRYREWPAGMIGPAEILWQPRPTSNTGDRKGKRKQVGNPVEDACKRHLWIRIHPSIFDETYKTLVKAISSYYQRPDARSADRGVGVEMKDLRGAMNSFEIMGPRSMQILEGILDPCRTESAPKKAVSAEDHVLYALAPTDSLIRKFLSHLKYAQTPQNIPERLVVGLSVYDPRLR